MSHVKEKKGSGLKFLVILLVVLILLAGGLLAYKYFLKDIITSKNVVPEEEKPIVIPEPEPDPIEIFQGEERPVAIMIDNHIGAVQQVGLNDAYIVYEIIVEGGETRLMAVYKGKSPDEIGPVRSSRHYFLDYALENDAIYVHFGWSPQAESDISTLGVNNINGLYYDSGRSRTASASFWRTNKKYAPHNAMVNMEKLMELADKLKYRKTSTATSILNYVSDEVELDGSMLAQKVTIPYSTSNTVKYEYDEETKTYVRYTRNKKQVDLVSGETVTAKNIIVTFAKNYQLADKENKDRQGLNNIGKLNGYYITNGKAIKITCEKKSRKEKTVYKDLEGNVIEVNDGNTFIQICPIDSKVVIEPGLTVTTTI